LGAIHPVYDLFVVRAKSPALAFLRRREHVAADEGVGSQIVIGIRHGPTVRKHEFVFLVGGGVKHLLMLAQLEGISLIFPRRYRAIVVEVHSWRTSYYVVCRHSRGLEVLKGFVLFSRFAVVVFLLTFNCGARSNER
jgi:hypothetical protein